MLYADGQIRAAFADTVLTEEGGRGLKITKRTKNSRIDVVVAMAMAALAALRHQDASCYNTNYSEWVTAKNDPHGIQDFQRLHKNLYLTSGG